MKLLKIDSEDLYNVTKCFISNAVILKVSIQILSIQTVFNIDNKKSMLSLSYAEN